ncbi:lipopolysaccharide biosynthesis protein [Mucilaginibacter lutimaris]|uniref:Lipopolysaccharide biosynthesis protein n=1 Tax=Mucilaginibacter lutimaris TaxID=931629 RepID=A0ABW2ZCD0_9SPHI
MFDKKKVIKDTYSNYGILIIKLFLAFFTTPIYLIVYGKALYGLFILSTSLATSLTFLDFGAGKSLIKYTAEYLYDKDKAKFQSSLSTALSINLISMVIVLGICFIIMFNAASFFKISAGDVDEARILFFIAIFSTLFVFMDFIPANILQGAGIFHEKNIYQILIIAVNVLIIGWVFYFKPSITAFGIANMALYVITYLIDFFLVKKNGILDGIRVKVIISKKLFQQSSFKYTKEIFLLSLVGFFSSQADKFIVGSLISVSAVSIYTIITRPFFLLKSLTANLYSVLQPHIIRTKSSGGDVSKLIVRITVMIFALFLFVLASFALVGQKFFELWMRTAEYDQYFLWAFIAVFNWALSGFYSLIYRTMFVTGDTKRIFRIDSVTALMNGAFSILLTYYMGFYGVILGTTIQTVFLSIFTYRAGNDLYGVKLNQIFTVNLNAFIVFASALIVAIGYHTHWLFKANILTISLEMVLLTAGFAGFLYRENVFALLNLKKR